MKLFIQCSKCGKYVEMNSGVQPEQEVRLTANDKVTYGTIPASWHVVWVDRKERAFCEDCFPAVLRVLE